MPNANALTHQIFVLFFDDEIRTFQEIVEWLRPNIKPETAYRNWKRAIHREPDSQEEGVRRGPMVMAYNSIRYLVQEKGWLEEADGKLAAKSKIGPSCFTDDVDYSFRLTSAGRKVLHGEGSEYDNAAKAITTRIWKIVIALYVAGKIRLKLMAPDGSPITGACLRNGYLGINKGEKINE